jgi:hypothetical protein
MILNVNRDYFIKQRQPVDLSNGEELCFLRGTDWILKCYLDELRLQRVNWFVDKLYSDRSWRCSHHQSPLTPLTWAYFWNPDYFYYRMRSKWWGMKTFYSEIGRVAIWRFKTWFELSIHILKHSTSTKDCLNASKRTVGLNLLINFNFLLNHWFNFAVFLLRTEHGRALMHSPVTELWENLFSFRECKIYVWNFRDVRPFVAKAYLAAFVVRELYK